MASNKVVFLGDSGVGKSQLINTLLGSDAQLQSTVGCSIEILSHQFAAGTPDECTEFVELWDIGGSGIHRNATAVFLENVSGVVFMHDISNSRSEENIAIWHEFLSNRRKHPSSPNLYRLSAEPISVTIGGFSDTENISALPTLVVGTHYDLCSNRKRDQLTKYPLTLLQPLLNQYERVFLDTRKLITAGSTNRVIFSRFFDAVIERSHSANKPSYNGRRRRLIA